MPADAVNVLRTVGVPDPCPLAAHQDDGLLTVDTALVGILPRDDLFATDVWFVHLFPPSAYAATGYLITVPCPDSAVSTG